MSERRTFNLPDEVSQYIDTIPNNEKSKFVSEALMKAITETKKRELLTLIDEFETGEVADQSAVDIIRELRETESGHL